MKPIPIAKLILVILATFALAALSACTTSQSQRDFIVTYSAKALDQVASNGKITQDEKAVLNKAILAVITPEGRNEAALIADAKLLVPVLQARGALTAAQADQLLFVLDGYSFVKSFF